MGYNILKQDNTNFISNLGSIDLIIVKIDFKDNKVYLTEDVPEHIAEFFKEIMSDFVLIIYEMFNPICPHCGSKLHRY